MYNSTALSLGKLYDDAHTLQHYNKQLLDLVRKEFYKKHIDFYGYERFINILQCMDLHVDEMKQKLNRFIEINGTQSFEMKIDALRKGIDSKA